MNYKRKIFILIIIAAITRLIIAGSVEFGNDEVYYYIYALHLQWNYFDHPPIIALLIKLTTLGLTLTGELFVRAGAVIGAAAGTWLSFAIGRQIANERTGYFAAFLYNTSIYSSIIAGAFILPDSPQVVLWLAGLLLAIKLASGFEQNNKPAIAEWLLFGLISGFCILSKVHGVFLWGGLGLYILLYSRKQLLSPGIYLSFLITLVLISPIFIWNYHNHFITWTYHSERVEVHQALINTDDFIQALLGQIFYNNPVNVVLIVIALINIRKQKRMQLPIVRLLMLMGLPIIIVVSVMSLFNPVLPHWSGPGFVALTFIAAVYLDEKVSATNSRLPVFIRVAAGLLIAVLTAGLVAIHYYPGTLSTDDKNMGSGDFTLDLSGWGSFEKAYHQWMQQHPQYASLKLVSHKWFPASHVEYYVARPMNNEVIGVGRLNDLHTYAWLNKYRNDIKPGEDALIIIPSNYNDDVQEYYGDYFKSVSKLQSFIATRNGKPARYFNVFLAKGYKANDEVHKIDVR